ncbi:MAG: hypothetical protein MHPSP_002350, partial [Paramarteilia canceri]
MNENNPVKCELVPQNYEIFSDRYSDHCDDPTEIRHFASRIPNINSSQHGIKVKNIQKEKNAIKKVKKTKLNGFICFMKDKRSYIHKNFDVRESAVVNMIGGRYWKLLDQKERTKYTNMAKSINKEKLM